MKFGNQSNNLIVLPGKETKHEAIVSFEPYKIDPDSYLRRTRISESFFTSQKSFHSLSRVLKVFNVIEFRQVFSFLG